MVLSVATKAQLVDTVLGQKRSHVSVLLRPYRIVDYKLERVVHGIGDGVHQTVFYENDTCNKFYWAVPNDFVESFSTQLVEAGYTPLATGAFAKDSMELVVKPIESGNATLFIAVLTADMKAKQAVAQKRKKPKQKQKASVPSQVELEAMPLLQQAILAEEADTTAKPPKDPQRHWVGEREGKSSILGW